MVIKSFENKIRMSCESNASKNWLVNYFQLCLSVSSRKVEVDATVA